MKAKKSTAKSNQMPMMPRKGSREYREIQREAFNKRFEAQKKSRGC